MRPLPSFYLLAGRRTLRWPFQQSGWTFRDVEDLLFYGVLGVILGGRLGFILFYNLPHYLEHPLEVFSWSGRAAWPSTAVCWACWWPWPCSPATRGRSFLEVTDLIAPCVPLGLAAGRIGNFINGELPGRAADPSLPWAMVFPQSGSMMPRHPSPLYQFAMEGVLLFILLWFYARRRAVHEGAASGAVVYGRVSGMFLIGYGFFRFVAEFFREPDAQLGLLALGMSMGQWLCVPIAGAGRRALVAGWPQRMSAELKPPLAALGPRARATGARRGVLL